MGWRREIEDLIRGMTGGLIIGIPLVYTMEAWQHGALLPPLEILRLLLLTYVVNLACVTWAGFRGRSDGGWRSLTDAIEATALALLTALVLLGLLGLIDGDHPLGTILGKIAVAALPISLGIAIANFIIDRDDSRTAESSEDEDRLDDRRATLLELGAAGAGALFLGANIAATEELPLLAASVPRLLLPVLVFFSLLITYGIVFVADFTGRQRRHRATGLFQHPVTETLAAYVISVLIGVGALWIFGQVGPDTSPAELYPLAVIMGLPAAIGGAAGRLAV